MKKRNKETTVVYYTQVHFLDMAIEYARLLSNLDFLIHLVIELSPNQLKANILDIETNLEEYPALTNFDDVVEKWKLEFLRPYFEKCISVHFAVYSSNDILKTRSVAKSVQKYITSLKVDFIHLDDFSIRTLFFLGYFIKKRKKIVASIHDPVTHSGEFQIKREFYRKIWFNLIPSFVVFSKYSKSILEPQLSQNKKIIVLNLLPYTVYKSFVDKDISYETNIEKQYISFVGRISSYKGIDLFVKAAKIINKLFPEERFFIGGKTARGYEPDFLNNLPEYIVLKNEFLSNNDLANVMSNSKLIICPYRDATQSGVVMAAYALECPVLVTPVGGLPEYIYDDLSGLVSEEVSVEAIASSMKKFLLNKINLKTNEINDADGLLHFELYNSKMIDENLYN